MCCMKNHHAKIVAVELLAAILLAQNIKISVKEPLKQGNILIEQKGERMNRKNIEEVFNRFSSAVFKHLKDRCAGYVVTRIEDNEEDNEDICCNLNTKISLGDVIFETDIELSMDKIMHFELSGHDIGIEILREYRDFINQTYFIPQFKNQFI